MTTRTPQRGHGGEAADTKRKERRHGKSELSPRLKSAIGTAAVAAASQLPAAKALKAAKWALKAAKRAGNAKKIASLQKKVSLLSKKGKTTTPKDRGHYRTPNNPSEAAMGSSGTAKGGGTGLRKGTGNSGVEGIAYRWDPSIATKQGTNLVGGVKATKSAAKKAAKKTKSSTKTTEFKPKTRQKKRKTGYEQDRKPEKTSRRTRERTPVEKKARQKAIELKSNPDMGGKREGPMGSADGYVTDDSHWY